MINNPLSDVVVIDFETYYDKEYSLRNMTTQEYIQDSRYETIMMAYKEFGKETEVLIGGDLFDQELKTLDLENKTVVAHNALFDVGILTLRYGIKPKRIIDTMGLANCFVKPFTGSAALSKCAEFIGAEDKGTTVQDMMGVSLKDMTSVQVRDYVEYCKLDVDICYELLVYLLTEMRAFKSYGTAKLSELENLDSVIRMGTEPKFVLDEPILVKELDKIRSHKQKLLYDAGISLADVMSNAKFSALLEARGVATPMKTSPTTGKQAPALAKSDMEFLALKKDPRVSSLVTARLECKSTLAEARLQRFINIYRASTAHTMCMPLRYYGAKTGRLSGSDSLNVQNLTRGSELRNALKAPKGYKIIAADLSQIEARLVAALANCSTLIEAFRDLDDVYSWFGSEYLFPDIKGGINKKYYPSERFLSKTALLSLGYAAGAERFENAVNTSGQATIDSNLANNIVNTYRKVAFPEVPKLWKYLNDALDVVVDSNIGVVDMSDRLGVKVLMGTYASFSMKVPKNKNIKPNDKVLMLPNGMPIVLKNLRRENGEILYDTKTGATRLYGASLLEKICQGIARIIICQVQEEMRRRFNMYKPILQVHDEVVYAVLEDDVEDFVSAVNSTMALKRDWIPRLPIEGESDVGDSYGDAK